MSIQIHPQDCYHCGLPNDQGNKYPVVILKQQYHMCCPGCQAVAQSIVDSGLESYYEFRTEPAARGDAALDNTLNALAVYDQAELQEEFVFDSGKHKQIQLTVEGITCAACGWLIEKQLAKVSGVVQISVNVGARRALVTWDDETIKLSSVLQQLKAIGYESLPFQSDQHEASFNKEQKSYLKKLGLAGLMTMQVMMLAMGQYFDLFGNIDPEAVGYFNAVSLLLTTPVVFYSGSIFYLSAYKAINARTVNMDIPVTIAIAATYIAGVMAVHKDSGEVYFESICMFVFFLLISRFLEHRSRHKATQISSNMLKYIPVTANKWQGDELVSVLAKQLQVNDTLLVKNGETVPVDGVVIDGQALIDESMLTGEFEPVRKTLDSIVYGGTVNQQGSVSVRVSKMLKNAMVNQVLRLQESALASKPEVAMMADKLSRYFVVVVLAVSALTYAFWSWQGNDHAFWITISILVATCPCALGLATPSALTCAMAKLNRSGILLKRASALEQLTATTDIVFDKTGTLTQGQFSLSKQWYSDDKDTAITAKLFNIAANLEARSEHPIAKAFSASSPLKVSDFDVCVGKGIVGTVEADVYQLGSLSFMQELGVSGLTGDSMSKLQCSTPIAGANVLMARNGELVAAFWVNDSIKPEVKEVLDTLRSYPCSVLSGDSQENVERLANELKLDAFSAQNTPAMKLAHIANMQSNGKRILMLGDGINDAPVLAASDVSIAVGNATDLARNAADVILLNADLHGVKTLLQMAQQTKRKIKQNMAWAIGYNLIVLPFAMAGVLTPWQAALGMSLSSIIVVYNSTRLLR